MYRFLKRHRETLLVILLGLMIFGALNLMMVNVDPKRFTNAHYGPWSAFKNMYVSGFDFYTYCIVSMWQPRYELYRHPLLAMFIWPLSELNKGMKDIFGINCAIYIVGAAWTMISTLAWLFLYKIIRKVIGLSWSSSLLYCLLFFSFSHVMIVTFYPDHMILSLCILLLSIYVIASVKGKMPIWKTLLLYFIGTGVTTTNSVKIWMMDMCGRYSSALSFKDNLCRLFKRSLFFFIPTLLLFGCFYWQDNNTQAAFHAGQKHMIETKMKKDSVFAKQQEEKIKKAKGSNKKSKQVSSGELFKCTDTSIDRMTLLYENIFGEGLLLHGTHILEDAGAPQQPVRPVIVRYTKWWYYAVNGIIVILALCGMWVGRHRRILWMVLPLFLFDMFLHVGMRFAAIDVYIMTAHWAFILPISIALFEKKIENSKISSIALKGLICIIAVFLWYHNLSLAVAHLSQF